VDFDGRKGFLRLVLKHDVPLVPVVSVGGQETALFLTRGEGLAKLLRLDSMFRLKVLPISLALPWGVNVGDMLGHVPLPAKITIDVLDPIDVRAEFGEDPDLDEVYAEVLGRMQAALTALQAERSLPVLG
jgi:1-acyl-sn-glycerol-3-phosphate acyltransferase